MSEVWGEDVTNWWLPNNEGYPTAIKTVRDFIAYRASKPADDWYVLTKFLPYRQDERGSPFVYRSTGVREMSGIFRKLDVDEHGILDGLRSPQSGSVDSNIIPWKHESSPDSQTPWT